MRRGGHHRRVAEGVVFAAFVLVVGAVAWWQAERSRFSERPLQLGVTFSMTHAQDLGLDWRRAYLDTLDDLGARHIRFGVAWSSIETKEGQFNWNDFDFVMGEAAARGAMVTPVIGRKIPRWPECYIPDWAERLDQKYQNQALLDYLENLVVRYQNHPALWRWQVENEVYFPYGECPSPDPQLFADEIALVRRHSDKPIVLTTSGENEFWRELAGPADILGVSIYRVTWDEALGYFVFPYGPDYYRLHALSVAGLVDEVFVSELQAEPWFRDPLQEMPLAEQLASFTPNELVENVAFARAAGFEQVDLWGVEWWYYAKVMGAGEMWETAKELWKVESRK